MAMAWWSAVNVSVIVTSEQASRTPEYSGSVMSEDALATVANGCWCSAIASACISFFRNLRRRERRSLDVSERVIESEDEAWALLILNNHNNHTLTDYMQRLEYIVDIDMIEVRK